jgi:hypothetical protein
MKPGIHGVRAHWIPGFIAEEDVRDISHHLEASA